MIPPSVSSPTCSMRTGYDEILGDTEAVPFHGRTLRVLGLQRLIQAEAAAGRPKDHMVIPILVATLEAAKNRK